MVLLEEVDRSVDLHYQTLSMAVEVDDESSNGVLAAELEVRKLLVAEPSPE